MFARKIERYRVLNSAFRLSLGLLLGSFLAVPLIANAENTGDHSQLRSLGHCEGCNFEGLDLSGLRMTSVDLTGSTFSNIDFTDARLSIAIFDNARLENVDFTSADLGGASFSDATLINVTFDGADLTAAVFEGAILEDSNLRYGQLCFTQMPSEMTNNRDCN